MWPCQIVHIQFDWVPHVTHTSMEHYQSLLFHSIFSWTQHWPVLCSVLSSPPWIGDDCFAASCSLNLHVWDLIFCHCLVSFCKWYTVSWFFFSLFLDQLLVKEIVLTCIFKGSLSECGSNYWLLHYWLLSLCNFKSWLCENQTLACTDTVHFIHSEQNKSLKHVWPWWIYKPANNMQKQTIKGRDDMQMNTIQILLNFGQNNKQVNTLPPC